MQAVILCGGLGTRLREETEFRPKPMVNIGTRPILWHIMKIYASQGVDEFILALGYKGEMIKNYFCHYELMNNDVTLELGRPEFLSIHRKHNEAGWKVTLADTGEKALKGSRLKKVQRFVTSNPFLLTYGDGVADINIDSLLAFHQRHGKIATITGVNPGSRFGELKTDGEKVTSFHEKQSLGTSIINGGYMVLDQRIFDYLSEDDDCDLEYGPMERLAEAGELMVYRHTGFWACMDTLRDMEFLNKLWNDGNAQWKSW